ncbi:cytochrome P450 [Mycena galericulata]|nr:cytochrome P450 [Mycena galericulata]
MSDSLASMTTTTIVFTLLLALVVYGARTLLRRVFSVLDNVPGPSPKSLLTGNLGRFRDPDGWDFHQEIEENYGQVVKIHGVFGGRQLYVFDPAALYSILVKDQDLYEEPPTIISLNRVLFGKGITSVGGDEHRKYRKIMMPAFSTANLRGMVPLFFGVAERARDGLIAPHLHDGPHTARSFPSVMLGTDNQPQLDLNSVLCRASMELIGRTGIGYSFDPMVAGQEQTDQYAESLRSLFQTAFKLAHLFPLLPLVLQIPSPSFRRFLINLTPSPTLWHLRDLVDFIHTTTSQLVKERKAAMTNRMLEDSAKDLMSLLVQSNMSAEGEMHLTDAELVSSTSTILFAATDTTTSSLNRMFHLLAMHPTVQDNLRAEILAAPTELDHDALVALPYLDAVLTAAHKYPPASPVMFREAVQDTVLPLSTPIMGLDGIPINAITVPKGTTVYIAIAAANHNKRIWGADALEFRPQRWTNGKADAVTTKMCGVYGNTMTSSAEAGAACSSSPSGFKFAELEMKALACALLRTFKFSNPDPRIKWRMLGIVPSPHIEDKPGLPMCVESLNDH